MKLSLLVYINTYSFVSPVSESCSFVLVWKSKNQGEMEEKFVLSLKQSLSVYKLVSTKKERGN
jgi:hypothetical protein